MKLSEHQLQVFLVLATLYGDQLFNLNASKIMTSFVQTDPLVIAINNQMDSVLSMLQLIHQKHMFLDRRPLFGLANAKQDPTDHVCLGFRTADTKT